MRIKKEVLFKLKKSLYSFGFLLTGIITVNKLQEKIADKLNDKYYKVYDKMVDDFSSVLINNELDDIYSIFLYTDLSLKYGCFSKDSSFEYSLDRDIIKEKPGIVNVTGKGVCMNEAAFLSDVYEACGYQSSLVYCSIEDQDYSVIPNHVITAVSHKGDYYYFDITNNAPLSKIDNFTFYNDTYDYTVKVNPIYNIVFDDNSKYISQLTSSNTSYQDIASSYSDFNDIFPLKEIYEYNKDKIDYLNDNMDNIKENSDMSYLMSWSILLFVITCFFGVNVLRKIKLSQMLEELMEHIDEYLLNNNCVSNKSRLELLCKLYDESYISFINKDKEVYSKSFSTKERYIQALYKEKYKYLFLKEFLSLDTKIINGKLNGKNVKLIEFIDNGEYYLFNPENNEYVSNNIGTSSYSFYKYSSDKEHKEAIINKTFNNDDLESFYKKEKENLNNIAHALKLNN